MVGWQLATEIMHHNVNTESSARHGCVSVDLTDWKPPFGQIILSSASTWSSGGSFGRGSCNWDPPIKIKASVWVENRFVRTRDSSLTVRRHICRIKFKNSYHVPALSLASSLVLSNKLLRLLGRPFKNTTPYFTITISQSPNLPICPGCVAWIKYLLPWFAPFSHSEVNFLDIKTIRW